jgi:hypothetical protein
MRSFLFVLHIWLKKRYPRVVCSWWGKEKSKRKKFSAYHHEVPSFNRVKKGAGAQDKNTLALKMDEQGVKASLN